MRRWFPIAAYGLGGFALAVAMVWGGFAVAGHRLSTPANPIQPLVAVPSSGAPSPNGDTPSARPSKDDPGSPSQAPPASAPGGLSSAPSSPAQDPSASDDGHPDRHSGGGGDD